MLPSDSCAREHLRRPHSWHVHTNSSMRQHAALRPSWHLGLYETGRRADLYYRCHEAAAKLDLEEILLRAGKRSVKSLTAKVPQRCVIARDYNGVVELSLSRQGSRCDGWCDDTPVRPFRTRSPGRSCFASLHSKFAVASGCLNFTTSVCSPYLGRSFFVLPLLRMCSVSSYEAANPHSMNAEPQLRSVRHLHSGCRIQGVGTRSANRATTRGSDFPQQQTLLRHLLPGPLKLEVAVRLSVRRSSVSR
jgi:hypothetical protein